MSLPVHSALALSSLVLLAACASTPPAPAAPEWTHQPTRLVDNGYIVYIGVGESSSNERSQVLAEGQALEDLANECSLIPKGTRIEDRYVENEKHGNKTYVKAAVEFQECDSAMRTNDPQEIRKIANVSFTQQLKRYQDLSETGELEARNDVGEITPPEELSPPPTRGAGWSDSTHFYVQRQYIAYQKEIVVMSPATAYAPASPATKQFAANVQPTSAQVLQVQEKSPAVRNQSWSHLPDRPALPRPAGLTRKSVAPAAKSVHPPAASGPAKASKPARKGRRGKHSRG